MVPDTQQQRESDAGEPIQKQAKKSRKLGCFLDDSVPTFFRRKNCLSYLGVLVSNFLTCVRVRYRHAVVA